MYTHIQSLDSRLEGTSLLLSSKGETEKELVCPVPHDILNDDAPKHVLDSTPHASLFEGKGSNVSEAREAHQGSDEKAPGQG